MMRGTPDFLDKHMSAPTQPTQSMQQQAPAPSPSRAQAPAPAPARAQAPAPTTVRVFFCFCVCPFATLLSSPVLSSPSTLHHSLPLLPTSFFLPIPTHVILLILSMH